MVDEKGDNFEFLHFTSFTREAFDNLVDIVKHSIYSNSIVPYRGKPKKKTYHVGGLMLVI